MRKHLDHTTFSSKNAIKCCFQAKEPILAENMSKNQNVNPKMEKTKCKAM